MRLTDTTAGVEGRMAVELGDYVIKVDEWVDRNPDGVIFLASDAEEAIDHFKSRYGSRVLSSAARRSTDGNSIHGHYDKDLAGSPIEHGRQVLVDAILLAQTAHLIRCHSRVTCYSLCLNPSLSFDDLSLDESGCSPHAVVKR